MHTLQIQRSFNRCRIAAPFGTVGTSFASAASEVERASAVRLKSKTTAFVYAAEYHCDGLAERIRAVIRTADNFLPLSPEPMWVNARVSLPRGASGLVILVHDGIAKGALPLRHKLAEYLQQYKLATCVVGLTNPDEIFGGRLCVDVETLAERLHAVVDYLSVWPDTCKLPIVVFGEGDAGVAALRVAADSPGLLRGVGAICSRPDLAKLQLSQIETPTLLVVPGRDQKMVLRNEAAFADLNCQSQIAVIGNASSALDEPGATTACRYLLRRWCQQHLTQNNNKSQAG